jgi:hypothetical protein
MVIAADRRQARTVFRYIAGLLDGSPLLSTLVEQRTKEGISLSNRVTIEVHTASFRAVRGYTIIGAVLDEVAFWRTEETAADPDVEIVNALRPGMATVPSSLLVAISSPYARKGALWQAYAEHYAKDGDPILVWQADTRSMNPLVPEREIARAYEEDESAAAAEYGAQFRRDIESFVGRETVEACVIPGRAELPPSSALSYLGFVDPSGGSQDSMTLAIAHREKDRAVLDLVRERRPPFSPEQVASEFAELLKQYRVSLVRGDRYGGEWPREQFRKAGIEYNPLRKPSPTSTPSFSRRSTRARWSCSTISGFWHNCSGWSGAPHGAARIPSTTDRTVVMIWRTPRPALSGWCSPSGATPSSRSRKGTKKTRKLIAGAGGRGVGTGHRAAAGARAAGDGCGRGIDEGRLCWGTARSGNPAPRAGLSLQTTDPRSNCAASKPIEVTQRRNPWRFDSN